MKLFPPSLSLSALLSCMRSLSPSLCPSVSPYLCLYLAKYCFGVITGVSNISTINPCVENISPRLGRGRRLERVHIAVLLLPGGFWQTASPPAVVAGGHFHVPTRRTEGVHLLARVQWPAGRPVGLLSPSEGLRLSSSRRRTGEWSGLASWRGP